MFRVGIDIGSVSVNLVVVNESGEIVEERYVRHKGQPTRTAKGLVEELQATYAGEIDFVATTGTGAKTFAPLIGASFTNEIIALTKSFQHLFPQVRSVIDIGGEDSKFILFDLEGQTRRLRIKDFSMNTLCAAGTGSFLDQQASRLGLHHRRVRRDCPEREEYAEDRGTMHGFCQIGHDPSPADCHARLRARGRPLLRPGP